MAIKPRSAKAKGRKFQQYVRDKLRDLPQCEALHETDIESIGMGQQGSDIVLSAAARAVLPLSIEVKHHKAFSVLRHYEQCEQNTQEGETSVLVLREDRGKAMVMITLDAYLNLLKEKDSAES